MSERSGTAVLTADQRESFLTEGYLVLRQAVSQAEIGRLREDIDRLVDEGPLDHPEDFSYEDGLLSRISMPLARSAACRHAYANPLLLGAAGSIYDDGLAPFSESIVFKFPERGWAVPWHQDGNHKPGDPEKRGINIGIYLHPSTQDNGCVWVVPRSHKSGPVDIDALTKEHGFEIPGAIPVETEPGDVVIHDRSVLHGSRMNRSPDRRVTYYIGFNHLPTVERVLGKDALSRRALLIPMSIEERRASGLYPDETPYASDALPALPDLTDAERTEILRLHGKSV